MECSINFKDLTRLLLIHPTVQDQHKGIGHMIDYSYFGVVVLEKGKIFLFHQL